MKWQIEDRSDARAMGHYACYDLRVHLPKIVGKEVFGPVWELPGVVKMHKIDPYCLGIGFTESTMFDRDELLAAICEKLKEVLDNL